MGSQDLICYHRKRRGVEFKKLDLSVLNVKFIETTCSVFPRHFSLGNFCMDIHNE